MRMTAQSGIISVGIGGWTYEPWRGVFYPKGLPHARELAYAGAHLTSIEINGTFYRTQSPATFRKWASEVPHKFVFSLKGPRYAVNRRVLSEAGDSIKRFLDSGVTELGDRLGPLLWQFAPTKKFDEKDFGGFLELLPRNFDGQPLRHVIEVRHDSFKTPAFLALLRRFSIPVVFAEHDKYPAIADITGDFIYAKSSRPAIRRKRWMAGPRAPAPGRAAASRRICRGSRKPMQRNGRAMSLFISSTRRNYARRQRPWP
jgi:uncharacterized protein YecE (DUF72 family)